MSVKKSQDCSHSLCPVLYTQDELIKEHFIVGKYPCTLTGTIKIIGIILLLSSLAMFVINSECIDKNTPKWFSYLLPSVLSIHVTISLLLYLIFSMGVAATNPRTWIKIDILIHLSLSVATIVGSALSMIVGKSAFLRIKISTTIGLCAGCTFLIGCPGLPYNVSSISL